MSNPDCAMLVALFDDRFAAAENTRLIAGGAEPLYLPANAECGFHRIIFRQDFSASALHEVAHWCIAGPGRRQRVDFGYWYHPDGRDAAQQREFERFETRPQALEWLFAEACGLPFQPSVDNLGGAELDTSRFVEAIANEAQRYCEKGLPTRAARFRQALAARFGRDPNPLPARFTAARLGLA